MAEEEEKLVSDSGSKRHIPESKMGNRGFRRCADSVGMAFAQETDGAIGFRPDPDRSGASCIPAAGNTHEPTVGSGFLRAVPDAVWNCAGRADRAEFNLPGIAADRAGAAAA